MAAERLLVPLVERSSIEPDLAANRRPHADKGAHQRGFSCTARADHRKCFTCGEREANVRYNCAIAAGRRYSDVLDIEPMRWLNQIGARTIGWQPPKSVGEPQQRLTGRRQRAPIGNRDLDRG